ncbi:MAG: hypothetical protein Kow00123_10990 [Anaerolineales bacterium]
MKTTKTKLTIALLLALVLVMTASVMPAFAGGKTIVVQKFVNADRGGVLRAAGVTLVIPAKALPHNAMITMAVDLGAREVTFSPDMDFARPVYVHFAFPVNGLNYWDGSQWVPVPMFGRTAILSHFSRYAWW